MRAGVGSGGKVPESSGVCYCRFRTQVLESSGVRWCRYRRRGSEGSGELRCGLLLCNLVTGSYVIVLNTCWCDNIVHMGRTIVQKNGAHVVKRGIRITLLLLGIPQSLLFYIFFYHIIF